MDFLADLVAPLNRVLFVVGSDAVTWAELLGFVTGGGCVYLTLRAKVSNFPVGIANSALFLVLFASARLWADSALQVVYIGLGFAGWYAWLRRRAGTDRPVIRNAGLRMLAWCGVFVVAGTAGLTVLLTRVDDVAPFWDALTTCLSLAAQFLLNAKRIQTWWFWIAADVIYIPLYASKDLLLTAVVYVLFLGMCLAGLRAWRAMLAERRAPTAAVTV